MLSLTAKFGTPCSNLSVYWVMSAENGCSLSRAVQDVPVREATTAAAWMLPYYRAIIRREVAPLLWTAALRITGFELVG